MTLSKTDAVALRLDLLRSTAVMMANALPPAYAAAVQRAVELHWSRRLGDAALPEAVDAAMAEDLSALMDALRFGRDISAERSAVDQASGVTPHDVLGCLQGAAPSKLSRLTKPRTRAARARKVQ